MDLLVRFDTLFRDADPRFAPSLSTLYRGAGDAMGGLAQALSHRDDDAEDYGLCVVQLKRALRGAAFARGALFPLRSILSEEQFDELFRVLRADGDRHRFRAGQGSIEVILPPSQGSMSATAIRSTVVPSITSGTSAPGA